MIIGLVSAFVLWYFYFSLEYFLNGGTIGRQLFLMPFQCFGEEILWNIPGGFARRIEYVRKNVVGDWNGSVYGRTRMWIYKEVRDKDLFAACAHDIMRGTVDFWVTILITTGAGFLIGFSISRPIF